MRYSNIEEFFIGINKHMISNTDGYIEDVLIHIKSLDCGTLSIAPLGYGTTKMSFLYNSYIHPGSIKALYRLTKTSKKKSIVFNFKGDQGCIKCMVLTRDRTTGPFNRCKLFFRTVDLSKKIIPDLFLVRHILEECDMYEHESLTLFIAQGYILPAAIANTYDTVLKLNKKCFNSKNVLHKKILSYIKSHEEFDLNNHNRVMGGYFKLIEYKYKELNHIKVDPVTYKECKSKLEVIMDG